jgi:hypothetical protein
MINDESGLSEMFVAAWTISYNIRYVSSSMSRTLECWKAVNSTTHMESNFFYMNFVLSILFLHECFRSAMVQNKHSELGRQHAWDEHGKLALGRTSSPPLSSCRLNPHPSSDLPIQMWMYKTPATKKNAKVWLELEDDESVEMEKSAQVYKDGENCPTRIR